MDDYPGYRLSSVFLPAMGSEILIDLQQFGVPRFPHTVMGKRFFAGGTLPNNWLLIDVEHSSNQRWHLGKIPRCPLYIAYRTGPRAFYASMLPTQGGGVR